jgi:hypothetical protein
MGRPAKALSLKKRIGTDRPDRLPSGASEVSLAPLPLGAVAQDQRRAIEAGAPWIRALDQAEVATYLALVDEEQEMRRAIGGEFTLTEPIVSPSGKVVGKRLVPHPLLKELRALEKSRRDLASVLGFDPSSRSRLGLAEAQAHSLLEGMLARFGGKSE